MNFTDPSEYNEPEGMCPECRNQAILNKQTSWYECLFCDWTDISLPETFCCTWCGEMEDESKKKIIDGEEVCRNCQRIIYEIK